MIIQVLRLVAVVAVTLWIVYALGSLHTSETTAEALRHGFSLTAAAIMFLAQGIYRNGGEK